jgi:hypothetical protein
VEHYLLTRSEERAYNPEGRFQTEDESKQFDTEIRALLDSLGIKYKVLSPFDTETIIKDINL